MSEQRAGLSLSLLESIVGADTAIEIVIDNAKSHAVYCETVDTAQTKKPPTRRRTRCIRRLQETKDDEETELDLDDLRDCSPPTDHYLHNLYPGREDGHANNGKRILCRWASSSDSDFAYVPSHFSFDEMLKEASSATLSARSNVSRPVRRSSLKSSPTHCVTTDDEEAVLTALSSNVLEEINNLTI